MKKSLIQNFNLKSISFLIFIIFAATIPLKAQLSEGGIPPSFEIQLNRTVPSVEMEEINVEALLLEDKNEESKGVPYRFGYPLEVSFDLNNSGVWEELPDGSAIWRLRIVSEGAYSLNLNYDWYNLPRGAKLFLYNDDRSAILGAFTSANNKEHSKFATALTSGDAVNLEYLEPSNVRGQGIISISTVVHGYKDLLQKFAVEDFGSSGSCNNNVNCPEGDPWSNEIRSAAMILTASNSRICSGSMVNNVRGDLTPYFLTANHCLGGNESWIFMFNYQSPDCNNIDGPTYFTVQGSTLLASNSSSDFALLLLNEAPPDSFEVHFAGWSAVDEASQASTGIHHPRGDIKKISFDFDPAVSSDYDPSPYLANSHWEVTNWDDGTTEPGSSGSPLFDQNHRIVGQLHGGWASCTSITQDYYGKFSMSWNYGSTPQTRLKDWLDPDNTGILQIDGWDPTIGNPDTVAPTMITDLSVIDPTSNSLTLNWTAPSDTSYGGVRQYDVRISSSMIVDTNDFNNADPVQFSGAPKDPGETETLLIEGLEFSAQYYFAVRSRDMWNNWSMISNSVSGTTYDAPVVGVNPLTMSLTLQPNEVKKDTFYIENTSSTNSTLDYEVSMLNNTFPSTSPMVRIIPAVRTTESGEYTKDNPREEGGMSIEGSGGPDLFGYEWIDSDEPNGPAYEWNDISTTGTEATNWTATGSFGARDEGYAGPFSLGFTFKFYGEEQTEIYVSSNGFLSFDLLTTNSFTNDGIPNTDTPNNLLAPVWDDLDGKTTGKVFYQQDGNRFIVQYEQWPRYSGGGYYTYQAVLYSTGKIMYYYKELTGSTTSATVGIENSDGTDGLQIAYNSGYLSDNLAVKISADPDWLGSDPMSGRIYNGNSAMLEMTFRSEDYPVGNYTMDVVVSSNDPVTPEVVLPVEMTIDDGTIPVELSSFNASVAENVVELVWMTATETNNQGFEVERKRGEEGSWDKIGYIEGRGSTTEMTRYRYEDKYEGESYRGKVSYRLKQIDMDGSYEYVDALTLEVDFSPRAYELSQNYPNPFNPVTKISYALPEKSEVKVVVYSMLGERVAELINTVQESGYYELEWNGSNMTSGVYIYSLQAKSEVNENNYFEQKKMILIK